MKFCKPTGRNGKRGRIIYRYCSTNTFEERLQSILKACIRSARMRNKLKFGLSNTNLTIEYLLRLYDIQKGRCIYTRVPFFIKSRGQVENKKTRRIKKKYCYHPRYLSIDRIDSSKPYCKGNVQLVTNIFNKMKTDVENSDLFKTFKRVYSNRFSYFGLLGVVKNLK